ncbi:hypothetical protein HOLleu_42102 [Holothuria leucospilota]|uniref:Uncharacterized protein n=1 Tax=Holothuria leucospilota TaxID=206669 RepID=A0A9Q0YAR6_HOLLE|nr:hypothetical protein HOLleu_42102 [Holothuria leucospilota]
MTKHVNNLVSSCNYYLRNLFRIGRYLDKETRHSVAVLFSFHALTTAMPFCMVRNQMTLIAFNPCKIVVLNLFSRQLDYPYKKSQIFPT